MTGPTLNPGEIAFHDNYLPSLADGTYTISATSGITGIATGTYFDNPVTQSFEVRGPQFSLPSTEVHSVYPPDNSNSTYGQYLPNVVLSRRVLPWVRHTDPTDRTVPWLCLLAFREGELARDSQTNKTFRTSTVSEFLGPAADVLKPEIDPAALPAEIKQSSCNHIRVAAPVFKKLAPKLGELKYLTHVREVDVSDQAFMRLDESGWFSVVTGNRLLTSTGPRGTRYFVHLVSFEGYYSLLKDPAQWSKKPSNPAEDKDIALVSLYNWTFLSQTDPLDFRQLVENLAKPGLGNADELLLRRKVAAPTPSASPAMQTTLDRLAQGYVPRSWQTEQGEQTYAWYRGPLTPTVAQPLPLPSEDYHAPSSDARMIYDPDNGVFDHSYSAAWSIGRALALADGPFSQALLRYRRSSSQLLGRLMDRLHDAGEASTADLSAVVKSGAVRDVFRDVVNTSLGTAVGALKEGIFGEPLGALPPAVPPDPVQNAKDFLAEPAVHAFLAEVVQDDLLPVAEWLAHRQLLYDIPFNHFVPDQLALPVESLRFFYVDPDWQRALIDGALSIGMNSSKDTFFTRAMRGVIDQGIAAEAMAIRNRLLGTAVGDHEGSGPGEAMTGILIRSAVASGWPGLQVKGFKGDSARTALKLLRLDRLSGNVLLALFLDVPDVVMLAEPQQGLCFGLEDGNVIDLRQLHDPPGRPTGTSMPAVFRGAPGAADDTVLNINDGAAAMVPTMESAGYLGSAIGPGQFAMEMVKSPEAISFRMDVGRGSAQE